MEYKNKELEDFESKLKNQKIAVIGLGVSNIPLIDYLYKKNANVTVFDDREEEKLEQNVINKIKDYGFKFYLGKGNLNNLKGFDLIFRSPSCLPTKPELIEEKNRGAIVTTEIEQLIKMAPCKIIGVTGSDGKTTTTTLTYEILKNAGYKVYLGGNIGIPLFTKLSEIEPDDIIVLELSSFQLMGMEISPEIAGITNITPNHLNIHKDYQEYIDAKKNIFKYQNEKNTLILNYDNEITRKCSNEAKGNVIFFSSKEKLDNGFIVDDKIIKQCKDQIREHILNTDEVKLKGKHNYENIAAALAATYKIVGLDSAIQAIKDFNAVEHRLEFVREINGVKWYNDSASSSPTRTISGLKAFDEKITLIAGGYDKNLDYTPIAKPIIEKVNNLILMGQTSEKIFNAVKQELDNQNKQLHIYTCNNLEETIKTAKKVTKPGEIVLFSPASASFDMFKNAVERGKKYKEFVQKI